MYDKLVILSSFLFPPKKKRDGKKENELATQVETSFFDDPFNHHPKR